jgi:hypothetical protein
VLIDLARQVPGKQFMDTVAGMIGDVRQYVPATPAPERQGV